MRRSRRGEPDEDEEEEDLTYNSRSKKRRRLNSDDEESEVEYNPNHAPVEEVAAAPDNYEIILEGQMLMIYQRDEDDPECISNFTIVLKGQWNLSTEQNSESFIYKRVGVNPEHEELLTSIFTQNLADRVPLNDFSKKPVFLAANYQHILDRFYGSQGQFQGFFKYAGVETTEKFTLIMNKSRSPTTGYVKKTTFEVGGYGENEMGPFTLEGTITLIPQDKMFEKDGLKNFKKMKVAKFELKKKYQKKVIEELAEDAVAERESPEQNEEQLQIAQHESLYQNMQLMKMSLIWRKISKIQTLSRPCSQRKK